MTRETKNCLLRRCNALFIAETPTQLFCSTVCYRTFVSETSLEDAIAYQKIADELWPAETARAMGA